jgi:serine phosphatase RsbU (regulator of sigma subunit)
MPETEARREVERATYRVLAEADSLEEAAPRILEDICRVLGWDFGAMWSLEASSTQLGCVELWSRGDLTTFERICREATFSEGVGLPGRVWARGETLWVADVVEDSNFPRAPFALEAGLHGAVAFPIFVRGRFFGAMEFFSRQVQEPGADLLEFFDAISKQIGSFIEWEHMEAELEFQKALLEYQGEASLDAIGVISNELRILYYNQRALDMFNISDEELSAGDAMPLLERLISDTADPSAFAELSSAVLGDPKASHRVETEMSDGRYLDVWTAPVSSPEGKIYGRAIYARDVTERRHDEDRLRRQEEWAAFLSEATRLLTESLNIEVILERLARLTVPILADWCSIHLVDVRGEPQQIAVAHIDPSKIEFARQLQEQYPPDVDDPSGAPEVIRTQTPMLWPDIPDELLEQGARDAEHLRLIKELQLRSAIIVPIVARDKGLGAITLVSAESGRQYTQEDLARAEELASRAAFPIENAKLFTQARQMAQTLQKSFLPPDLPDIPGVDVSARYFAAGEGELIGGDFYDAFRIDNRRWGVVLGDVSGKGLEAATVTTLARHTMRGAALTADRPSDALRVLNTALLEQNQTDRFCTGVYATIEPRFARVRVTVSSGGHPAPYVIRNDGTVEPIACGGTLLGFMDGISLRDAVVDLEFGDKLFLYTDGVLDIRQKGGTFGTEGLEKLLYECSKRGTEGAAEHISQTVAELQQGRATDDIAFILLGVRSSVFNITRRRSETTEDQ